MEKTGKKKKVLARRTAFCVSLFVCTSTRAINSAQVCSRMVGPEELHVSNIFSVAITVKFS